MTGSRYRKLDRQLSDLYQSPLCACPEHLAHDSEPSNPFTEKDIKAAFNVVHSALKMTPELLSKRPIQRVIRKTADYFSGAISERVPPKMADALRKDLYIFSGFRTYHELKESAERLLRPDGSLKPFSEFYQDTLKVRDKYNKAWLKAEYNYAVRTADAAARWAEIEKDKEHIDLLYETVGDSNVRPDHAALEGVCLPVDDPFWSIAYPPNGWNCRCRVLRVAKGSHPYSNSGEATEAFIESTSGKSELFRYNPGKEQRIFSDKHPYYSKRGIRHCAISGDKLAANLDKNEECEVLRNLIKNQTLRETEKTLLDWAKKEQGLHEAPTTKTGKILISKKVAERYLHHAVSKEEKAILTDIVTHNEKLKFLREDELGGRKDMSNPKDVKNVERKKQRGVIGYTVYTLENEKGKWKIGFEKTNHRGDLHEAPYYIFPMSSKKKEEN